MSFLTHTTEILSSSFISLRVDMNSLAGGISHWLLCLYPHYLIFSGILNGPWIPEDEDDVMSKLQEPFIQRRNVKSQKKGKFDYAAVQIATLAHILPSYGYFDNVCWQYWQQTAA